MAGRKKGSKSKDAVVLLNKFSCNFYTTIKNDDGEIIGRDYSIHKKHVAKLMKSFGRAIDTQLVKFLKAMKKVKYKEDIIKYVPNLIVLIETDPTDYPIGTFYAEDTITDVMTHKKLTMKEIDDRFKSICEKLEEDGRHEILAGLLLRWNKLETCEKPPTKAVDPREVENKQLSVFSWD